MSTTSQTMDDMQVSKRRKIDKNDSRSLIIVCVRRCKFIYEVKDFNPFVEPVLSDDWWPWAFTYDLKTLLYQASRLLTIHERPSSYCSAKKERVAKIHRNEPWRNQGDGHDVDTDLMIARELYSTNVHAQYQSFAVGCYCKNPALQTLVSVDLKETIYQGFVQVDVGIVLWTLFVACQESLYKCADVVVQLVFDYAVPCYLSEICERVGLSPFRLLSV